MTSIRKDDGLLAIQDYSIFASSEPSSYAWSDAGNAYYDAGIGCFSGVQISNPDSWGVG
jgi:hypothetical protein